VCQVAIETMLGATELRGEMVERSRMKSSVGGVFEKLIEGSGTVCVLRYASATDEELWD